MADDHEDHRRFKRFDFGGTAMLVFDDDRKRRTLAITNYRNISQTGACISLPEDRAFALGERIFLMPERYRRKREAVIVNLGTGKLHLEIPSSQALSEFEIAEILERLALEGKAK